MVKWTVIVMLCARMLEEVGSARVLRRPSWWWYCGYGLFAVLWVGALILYG